MKFCKIETVIRQIIMRCDNCGNETNHLRISYNIHGRQCVCSYCGQLNIAGIPDVYFDKPYFDEHLADEKHKAGRQIWSRNQKARIMKELGLREAGDRNRGARIKYEGKQFGERKTAS